MLCAELVKARSNTTSVKLYSSKFTAGLINVGSFAWKIFWALLLPAISSAYYPPQERGFGLTMSRSAIAIGHGSLGGLIDEFYPDIIQHLFRRKAEQHQERKN